jgi:hypothetical protein
MVTSLPERGSRNVRVILTSAVRNGPSQPALWHTCRPGTVARITQECFRALEPLSDAFEIRRA